MSDAETWFRSGLARPLLKPDTTAEGFEPIVLTPESGDEVRIVAELVAVLPER